MKPVLLTIAGEPIYSYPLLMGIAWGVGYNLAKENWFRVKKETRSFNILFLTCFVSAWLGAKFFFLLFSAPNKITEYVSQTSFWLGGGFVFYGGLIFGVLSLLLLRKLIKNFNYTDVSLFIPPLFMAHAIGRVGCFLAGCCYGSQCPIPHIELHPVQLYEVFGLVILFYYSSKELKKKNIENIFLSYLWGYSGLRFLLEFFRDDSVRGHHYGLSTSQWVSIVLFCFGLIFFWSRRIKRNTL